MNLYAISGLLMIVTIVVILYKQWFSPLIVLVVVPPIFGFIAGYSPKEVADFIEKGIETPMSSALVAMFAIVFFSIMTDAGLFDPVVNWLRSKCKNHVPVVTVTAALMAHITHIETESTTTLLLVIPAMLPIFDRLKVDRINLYVIIGMAVGVMNVMPWGGGVLTASAASGISPVYIFQHVWPALAVGIVYNLAVAYWIGRRAQARPFTGTYTSGQAVLEMDHDRVVRIDRRYWLNLAATVLVIALMFEATFPGFYVFMFGLALALIINYRSIDQAHSAIDRYAKNAFRVTLIIWAAGIFIGVLTMSDMLPAIADLVVKAIPDSATHLFGLITAACVIVFGTVFTNDGMNLGLMPIFMHTADHIGYPHTVVVLLFPMLGDAMRYLCFTGARPWMVAGMLGVGLMDCFKRAALPIVGLALVETVAAVGFGIITF